ncbi:MAG: hypothetical protein Q8R32_01350 [bacterium]|nr:hypothetical protein [bacterium]
MTMANSQQMGLLCSALSVVDRELHGTESPILLTDWSPPAFNEGASVAYVPDRQRLPLVPRASLSSEMIPEAGGFFLVFTPHAERAFRRREEMTSSTKATRETVALFFAAVHVWKKIQRLQEDAKVPASDRSHLLLAPNDLKPCAGDQREGFEEWVVGRMAQVRTSLENVTFYRRTYGNEWEWWFERNIEAYAVANVATQMPTVGELLAFLKRLKQRADAKARILA